MCEHLICGDVCKACDVVTEHLVVHAVDTTDDLLFRALPVARYSWKRFTSVVCWRTMVAVCATVSPAGMIGVVSGLAGGTNMMALSVLEIDGEMASARSPS